MKCITIGLLTVLLTIVTGASVKKYSTSLHNSWPAYEPEKKMSDDVETEKFKIKIINVTIPLIPPIQDSDDSVTKNSFPKPIPTFPPASSFSRLHKNPLHQNSKTEVNNIPNIIPTITFPFPIPVPAGYKNTQKKTSATSDNEEATSFDDSHFGQMSFEEKERTPPTYRERTPPTYRERTPPTYRERTPPTYKERTPPTYKERTPPTYKERTPPTYKERTPDKEMIPETNENDLPEGSVLVDGDILIKKENLHLWESGMVSDQAWGNFPMWKNPIPVAISPDIQVRSPEIYKWILESIQEIMKKTCIKFKRLKKPINAPFMLIKLSGRNCKVLYQHLKVTLRCFATFGQQFPRANEVSLGQGCAHKRTPAHEIMHSLGRFHEQTRMDRDKFIKLVDKNINCPGEYQKRPSTTFGIPYDYYSVMHYSVKSCSTGEPTMIFPKGVDAKRIGREEWLTESDILHIKRRYCNAAG